MATPIPHLPPAYRLRTVDAGVDPFVHACAQIEFAADGDFYWCERADRLDCAIHLQPELSAQQAGVIVQVAMVGIGDAIGALAPPVLGVEFGWPDRLIVNGAVAGGIRLATAGTPNAETVPDWQVMGVTVVLQGDPSDRSPGMRPEVTTLSDEGASEISAAQLAESFSRHLLTWVHRWQVDGFAPISDAWLNRAFGHRELIDWRLAEGRATGRFIGLDEDGGLLLANEESGSPEYRTVALASAMTAPTWEL